MCSVYVPTNHLYIGDIFLINSEEIIRPNLSVREGIGLFFLANYFVISLFSLQLLHLMFKTKLLFSVLLSEWSNLILSGFDFC